MDTGNGYFHHPYAIITPVSLMLLCSNKTTLLLWHVVSFHWELCFPWHWVVDPETACSARNLTLPHHLGSTGCSIAYCPVCNGTTLKLFFAQQSFLHHVESLELTATWQRGEMIYWKWWMRRNMHMGVENKTFPSKIHSLGVFFTIEIQQALSPT